MSRVNRRWIPTEDHAFVEAFRQKLEQDRDAFRRRAMVPHILFLAIAIIASVWMALVARQLDPLVLRTAVVALHYIQWTVETAKDAPHTKAILRTGNNPRLYGILAKYALVEDPDLQRIAHKNLARILDRVRPEYAGLLKIDEAYSLGKHLVQTDDHAVTIALLKAIERTNDTRFFPAVRTIVSRKYEPSSSRRVMTAAVECAAALEKYAEKAKERGLLLRPAVAAPESALLRPAASVQESNETLLHTLQDQ